MPSYQWFRRKVFAGGAAAATSPVIDGVTLDDQGAGGAIEVAAGGITALQLAADAVETAKIKDGNVTAAKVDGTAGTVAASKVVKVDSNKDVGSFRDVTLRKVLGITTADLEAVSAPVTAAAGRAVKVTAAAGADNAAGSAWDGGKVIITGGAGGASSGGDGDGGAGGDIILAPGTGGAKNGSGTAGRDGLVFLNLPTTDPVVAGALWADAGVVKVSAGP